MTTITQRSFASGEISPSLQYRVDLNKYLSALSSGRNAFIHVEGGVSNRPGTEFIAEVRDSSQFHRIIPFIFNTEQAYALVFGYDNAVLTDSYMWVVKDGGVVLEGAGVAINSITAANPPVVTTNINHSFVDGRVVYLQDVSGMRQVSGKFFVINNAVTNTFELQDFDGVDIDGTGFDAYVAGADLAFMVHEPAGQPYTNTTNAIRDFKYTQSADVMTLVQKETAITSLTRADHDDWTFDTVSFTPVQQPPTALTLGTIGTASGSPTKTYGYVVTAVGADGEESLPTAAEDHLVDALSTTYGSQLTWTGATGAVLYNIYKAESHNAGVYGYIGSSETTTFDDYNIAPDMDAGPPKEKLPFDSSSNYPGCVTYYSQRLMYGSTINKPQTVIGSEVANYNSMRTHNPIIDSDSVEFTLASNTVNAVRHLVSLDSLIILTSGAEFAVTEGADDVLTPTSVGARAFSYNGCSDVMPCIIDNNAVYAQGKGSRLRDLRYEYSSESGSGGYVGTDLTILARHFFKENGLTYTIRDMAFQKEPFGILWVVRSDGKLLALTYQREHQVVAWTLNSTDGEFESVCSIPEGDEDAVYFIIKRVIGGQTKRFIERLHTRSFTTVEEAFFVDCGITYDGVAADTISGLEHLEGETVIVLADGIVYYDHVVTDGQITLPREHELIHIGLPYTSDVGTLNIDSAERTERGNEKNVAEVTIAFERSRGGYVGPNENMLDEIRSRGHEDGYDTLPLRSREVTISIQPDWNEGGKILYRQTDPLPFTILAITPSYD